MLSYHREAQAAPAELPGLRSLPGKSLMNILTLFCPENCQVTPENSQIPLFILSFLRKHPDSHTHTVLAPGKSWATSPDPSDPQT